MQLVGVSADLVVEGDAGGDAGTFRGRVLAIAMDDTPAQGGPADAALWLLVADDQRPAPIWVARETLAGQRLGR